MSIIYTQFHINYKINASNILYMYMYTSCIIGYINRNELTMVVRLR